MKTVFPPLDKFSNPKVEKSVKTYSNSFMISFDALFLLLVIKLYFDFIALLIPTG
jgi:hypothetical protein